MQHHSASSVWDAAVLGKMHSGPGRADSLPISAESGEGQPKEVVKAVGIGVSIFMLAVGAILAFALEVDAEGINLNTVGVILMIVGALGLLLSMLFWSSFAPFNRGERTVVRDREREVV